MIKQYYFFGVLIMLFFAFSCNKVDPNKNAKGRDTFELLEIDHQLDKTNMAFTDVMYVPIYSDIYVNSQNQRNLLSATLSIRNTSIKDSLFISKIDYYSTNGALVRSYLENPISILPMGTINYVIEKEDDTGGAGANFIVELSASNHEVKPIVQAIMIGENGSNQGFAFAIDGYTISHKSYTTTNPLNN